MSLRRASLVFGALLAVIGAAVAATLILLTTSLHQAAREVETDVESLRIGEELEFGLVSLRNASESLARDEIEEVLRTRMSDADEYAVSPRDLEVLANLERQVESYIESLERSWHSNVSKMQVHEETRGPFEAAFAAARAWVRLNVEQSRSLKTTAARWDRIANVTGMTAIALLLVGLAAMGLWWQRRAVAPALKLVGAIDRYAQGERTARASEQGPEELRTIAHRFNDMASALDRQQENQLAFLAGVAHDIRNPLAALQMATGMIPPDQPLPPEPRLRQLVARIDRQIRRLERMVYDFLDASRIEAGMLQLQLDDCDLRDVVHTTLDLFEPATRTHRFVLTEPDVPTVVVCDPMRIEQVFTNLISNAVKYSPTGGTVRIALAKRPRGVTISVADEGLGIPQHELGSVFEPFRSRGTSMESIPGVGLGLYVARNIVAAHGGTISVASTQGEGTTFTVELPEDVHGGPADRR